MDLPRRAERPPRWASTRSASASRTLVSSRMATYTGDTGGRTDASAGQRGGQGPRITPEDGTVRTDKARSDAKRLSADLPYDSHGPIRVNTQVWIYPLTSTLACQQCGEEKLHHEETWARRPVLRSSMRSLQTMVADRTAVMSLLRPHPYCQRGRRHDAHRRDDSAGDRARTAQLQPRRGIRSGSERGAPRAARAALAEARHADQVGRRYHSRLRSRRYW